MTTIVYIVIAITLLLLAIGIFLIRTGLYHKPLGRDENRYLLEVERNYPGTKAWIEGKRTDGTLKETYLTSDKGIRVHAYYMATEGAERTVVLTHGYSGCAMQMMPMARMWIEYFKANVLIHDMPNHGRSEGDMTCMGWEEKWILQKWINKAHELFPNTDIYLHGISMGGATTIMTSGEKLPEYVKGIVSDSAFYSAWGVFEHDLKKRHIPVMPCLYVTSIINKIINGWSFGETSTIDMIGRSELPILLVHGDADKRVPLSHAKMLYAVDRTARTELWIVPGAAHVAALMTDPDGYREKIRTFFEITNIS